MAFVVGVPGYARAEGSGVGVVTTLVGEATVVRTAAAQPRNLRMRDSVLPLDRITTKERSLVHVLMGGKALLTVKELSVLTVTEAGGRATVDLQSGKIGLAVVHEKMKPDDVIEVTTPHAVAAVRGTVLVVEIVPGTSESNQPGHGEDVTNVHLIHGKLDVSLRSNPGSAPVRLESLQTVSVTRDALGETRPLDLPTATSLTTDLKPAERVMTAIPEKLQAAVDRRQSAIALATAAELTRGGQTRGTMRGSGTKLATTTNAKVTDGVSSNNAIVPVAEGSEEPPVPVESVTDSLDGVVSSLGSTAAFGADDGTGSDSSGGSSPNSGSGGSAQGNVGTVFGGGGGSSSGSLGGNLLGNGGPWSGGGSGVGKGPSLNSGVGSIGNLQAPATGLPLFKKK